MSTSRSMLVQQNPLTTGQGHPVRLTAHRRRPAPFTKATTCRAYSNERPQFEQAGKVAAAACLSALLCAPGPVFAREKIAEFQASGFLFKDTVEVNALDDPAVPGVTIYFSDFKRSLVDKLQKDFFAEPSQASLTCSIAPDTFIKDPTNLGGLEGKEVFSEKKGLSIFKDKTLRVRRVYDPSRQTLLYVAYSTRLSTAADEGNVSSGRYRTSICALRLPPATAPALEATEAAVSAAP